MKGYSLPLAYFITGLVAYAYSFFAVLRKMAENSRLSKLSEKDDECIFSWKLFTAWDYMIGNSETAHNRVAAIVVGFKEALLEEAEKQRTARSWKIVTSRILVNIVVLALLVLSVFAVVFVVKRSTEVQPDSSFWRKNEISVVMSLITSSFPMLFEGLGFLEKYHPRKQLRLQLARIMVLNLLNLYSLIFALFDKISDMTKELQEYLPNVTISSPSSTVSSLPETLDTNLTFVAAALIQKMLATTTQLPEIANLNTFPQNFTNLLDSNASWIGDTDDDLKQNFVDYLTYMLSSFTLPNSTDTNSTIFNITEDYINSTTDAVTDFISTEITTILPDLDERFNTEIDNITSISTLQTITTVDQEQFTTESQVYNYTYRKRLRSLCWETMFGQELIKITVMDFVMTIISTLFMDFFRGIFVRVMNRCWCWDLEKKFPQYADFKVAENILHLVNNQGMVWMGMFFSPGLVVLNVLKLYLLMYFRTWTVLTCNIPHEVIFRASRSNNFYYALLLMMLFLCVLPVGYAIVMTKPSLHCGPFSNYSQIYWVFTQSITDKASPNVKTILNYIASPGTVIPLLVLLILVIYYLLSLTAALREANDDLKMQLRRERTEERKKMFRLVDRRRRGGSGSGGSTETPFGKWKKLLSAMPDAKSSEEKPDSGEVAESTEEKAETAKNRDFVGKFIRKALGKPSTSEPEDDHQDGTDTEQHDSLPEDQATSKPSLTKTVIIIKRKETLDKIPVIKISKTESSEKVETIEEPFKPKIKYALKKQNSEYDEDAICHFGQEPAQVEDKEESSTETFATVLDLEADPRERDAVLVVEELVDQKEATCSVEVEDNKSTPTNESGGTESSACYNDFNSL